jgi:hypothetical protein
MAGPELMEGSHGGSPERGKRRRGEVGTAWGGGGLQEGWGLGPWELLRSVLLRSDRARVPDLSERWIISIGGGGDSRDPTMNEQVVAP